MSLAWEDMKQKRDFEWIARGEGEGDGERRGSERGEGEKRGGGIEGSILQLVQSCQQHSKREHTDSTAKRHNSSYS
jgi:hypothetical protein